MARVEAFVLKSGRRVAVHVLAEHADGPTVAFCHPSPGSGAFDPDPAVTAERAVSLIALDRPGYGGSEPMALDAWASVARVADDLAEVLSARGKGPFGVAGWSAGGRVALALAARHPALVSRVVVIATPAPDEEVSWIPPEHKAGLDALRGQSPEAATGALAGQMAAIVPADPRAPEALDLLGRSPADEHILAAPGVQDRLGGMIARAFAQGAAGMAAEVAGYSLQPWGFVPEEVHAKTLLLYGDKDPIGGKHARWWKARLSNARVEMAPGLGHFLAIPLWRRALAHLAPGAKL